MKKVNFHAMPVADIDDNVTPHDLHILIGKTLFQLAEDPDEQDLSKKIYHSEDEVELSEKEEKIIMKYHRCFKYVFQLAIIDALK